MIYFCTQVFTICSALVLLATLCLSETVSLRGAQRQRRFSLAQRSEEATIPPHDQFRLLPPASPTELEDDYELLDICLLASVDGKFHGLNRTSGQILWTMAAPTNSSSRGPAALAPLVRTQHLKSSSASEDMEEDEHQEMYIIEPQSGDIYVLPSPDAPLQSIPLTMSRLVDVSPFSLPNDKYRMFLGKKETSLLMLELETGTLKGTMDSSSECPWSPFAEAESNVELDLDELDGTKPAKEKPVSTKVLIGRTDYQMTIHTRPQTSSSKAHTQILNFSAYGPNNQDQAIQATYRRTPDDMYIQSMPSGEVLSFVAAPSDVDVSEGSGSDGRPPKSRSKLVWANTFSKPIVAVFDIIRSPNRQQPLVLLQPQPRFEDIFPSFGTDRSRLADLDATFIGYLEETGALYAMSPLHYPLVLFHPYAEGFDPNRRSVRRPAIDAPPRKGVIYEDTEGVGEYDPNAPVAGGDADDVTGSDLPTELDDVARARKLRELCSRPDGSWDGRCLVGKRPVGVSSRSRSFRLLDGVPSVPSQTPGRGEGRAGRSTVIGHEGMGTPEEIPSIDSGHSGLQTATTGGVFVASLVFLVGLWYLTKRHRSTRASAHSTENPATVTIGQSKVENGAAINGNGFANKSEGTGEHTNGHAVHSTDFAMVSDGATQSSSTAEQISLSIVAPPSQPNGSQPIQSNATTSDPAPSPIPPHTAAQSVPAPVALKPSSSTTSNPPDVDVGDDLDGADDDSDREGGVGGGAGNDNLLTPGKKKGARRRKRGKKGKGNGGSAGGGNAANGDGNALGTGAAEAGVSESAPERGIEESQENVEEKEVGPSIPAPLPTPSPLLSHSPSPAPMTATAIVTSPQQQQAPPSPPLLQVSDEVLGFGSHGTVVYRGSLQGRAVAVKRLLQDFVTLASREVDILQESDDHPNVIRYFYQERHSNFLYIALELCPANLADVIERPDLHREISNSFDPKRALTQITSGLRHLHALKIIHRDIKPQNILISAPKRGAPGGAGGSNTGHRMLISDFGLCKKLEVDQTSFLPTTNGAMAAGTVGWRAPEILKGEVKIDELVNDESSTSSRSNSSVGTATNGSAPAKGKGVTRLTKSVDIFALGCLFYYTLTNGGHPYGDRYEREINIMKDTKNLSGLESFGEEGLEAIDLITKMLEAEASARPDTSSCLLHPFFWTPARRLAFLQDASDRFEIMCRDPRDPDLIELEKGAYGVVGNDWHQRLDKVFIENLGKYRKYDGKSIQDLMRALRNKKHHYQDLPDNVKRHLGPLPDGFLSYFTRRFPNLFMHVHSVVSRTNLRYEAMFKTYFELSDH